MVVVSLALRTSDTKLITQLSLEMHPFVCSFCFLQDLSYLRIPKKKYQTDFCSISIHLRSKVESFGNKNSNRFVSVIAYFAFGIATRNEPRNTRPLSFGIKLAIWKTCCLRAYQLNSPSVSLYSQANYFLFILKRLILMPSASFFPRIRHL